MDAAPEPLNIAALRDPARLPYPGGAVELLETHISWVLLAGDHAYKLKKPVDLGFLDFSTPELRAHFCREELRLNRRLAPRHYLAVLAVTGTPGDPRIGGDGPVVDHAVVMRRFPQDDLLDARLVAGTLEPAQLDAVADTVAAFHAGLAPAEPDSGWGTPQAVRTPVDENFQAIAPVTGGDRLAPLRDWCAATHERLSPVFHQRLAQGWVRECHGDMHLGNMAWDEDAPVIFDAIEFSPALRWIDVMSELAFLVSDLAHRGRADLGRRVLNRWLEHSGDYGGLAVLRYYQVYRTLVRAKVTAIRLQQLDPGDPARGPTREELERYLDQATAYTQPLHPRLVITRGLSGSGKSVLAGSLVEAMGAVRLRADVERKRLAGLPPLARTHSPPGAGLYGPEMSARTLEHLAILAREVLASGYPVVVDATFLGRPWRDALRGVAAEAGVPFVILEVTCPHGELRRRVAARRGDASEADLAVLARQLDAFTPLDPDEAPFTVTVDNGGAPPAAADLATRVLAGGARPQSGSRGERYPAP